VPSQNRELQMDTLQIALMVSAASFIAGTLVGARHGYLKGELNGSRRGFKRGIDVSRKSRTNA
jgi:F0F1-type ATP synthase assembly protein I